MAGILWSSGGNGQQEFDQLLDKTTSDLLPAQTPVDLFACLQLADMIRSTAVQPAAACKSIEKRLKHDNPNVQILALDTLDICIKNGGTPFLLQVGSKQVASEIESLGRGSNAQVREKALKDLQDWAGAFAQKPNLRDTDLVRTYERMRNSGSVQFPPKDESATAAMVDSLSAPEWTDAPYCTRCRTDFSTFNRKHHCRNCGQVFDQACSSSTAPLPHYGILQPVRVCDGCLKKIKEGKGASVARSDTITKSATSNTNSSNGVKRSKSRRQQEEEDLERAIAASLQESQPQLRSPPPALSATRSGYNASYFPTKQKEATAKPSSNGVDQEDADLAAAIAASLREVAAAPTAPAESYSDLYPRSASPTSSHYTAAAPARPRIAPLPSYDLSSSEQDAISNFVAMSQQRPSYIGHRERQVYEDAARAQPRLERGLEDAYRRRELLVDMNRKLSEVTRLYESLLDGRLRHNEAGHGHDPAYGYPVAAQGMNGHAHGYQQQPYYAAPYASPPLAQQQHQYAAPNPGQPLPQFAQVAPQPYVQANPAPPPQQQVQYAPATGDQQQQQQQPQQQEQQQPAGWYKASSFPAAPKAPILPAVPNETPWENEAQGGRRHHRHEADEEEEEEKVGELIEL